MSGRRSGNGAAGLLLFLLNHVERQLLHAASVKQGLLATLVLVYLSLRAEEHMRAHNILRGVEVFGCESGFGFDADAE